jgi:hypothetical protein
MRQDVQEPEIEACSADTEELADGLLAGINFGDPKLARDGIRQVCEWVEEERATRKV